MSTKKLDQATGTEPATAALATAKIDSAAESPSLESPATSAAEASFFTVPVAPEHEAAETVQLPLTNAAAPTTTAPRTRWAAIIWGLLLTGLAAGTLALVVYPSNRSDFAAWFLALPPSSLALYALLAVGALLLIAGLAGLLRRGQRGRLQRKSAVAS